MTRSDREVEALLLANLHLVSSVARRQFPTLREDQDLLQTGRIALWQAARRWDGERPFAPYARVCISNAMTDCLRREQAAHRADPLDPDLPAPDRDNSLADSDLRERIRAAWPAGSRQRRVLLELSGPTAKPQLARELGLTTNQLTRLARRAWRRVPACL